MITVRYGSWLSYGDTQRRSVESTVEAYLLQHCHEPLDDLKENGTFTKIVADYRDAINKALPNRVDLVDDEFFGPANPVDFTWERGELDLRGIVKQVDLAEIARCYGSTTKGDEE